MTRLLEIQPKELKFVFEVKKQSSCSICLTNNAHHNVAFKVKTTSPKKYSVRPNVGVIDPKSTCAFIENEGCVWKWGTMEQNWTCYWIYFGFDLVYMTWNLPKNLHLCILLQSGLKFLFQKMRFGVTMQSQKEAPPDMVCKDKFLIQSTVVPVGTTEKDITSSTFAKNDNKHIEEVKMRVALISAPESFVPTPINGVFKQGPFYEPSVLKDSVLNRVEILNAPQMYQIAKDAEFKMTNGHESNTSEDVELKPEKDVIHGQESKLSDDTDWVPVIDIVNEKELKLAQDEELKQDKDAISNEHSKPAPDMESPSLNEEIITANAVELKLASDIDEMKSKLHVLESKLNETESTISKLTEEKRQSSQERKILQEELDFLRSRTSVKRVYVGFPRLFVVMIALISIELGYLLHS